MSSGKDESIGWMYDGAKSNVNREDYLMGKKIDKNFEKYSDVVNEEKPEAVDRLVHTRTISSFPTGLKTSSLQTDVIRSEDPFVAVRVREETKRREVMDNPLMKLKLQKMLKTMMTSKGEKKKEKKSKSKKKKKRSKSSSSSDSSEDEDDRKSKSKKRSPSPKRARRISDDRSRRGSSPDRKHRRSTEDSRRRRRDSRSRTRSRSRSRSAERKETQRRRGSRSDDRSKKSSHRDDRKARESSYDRSHDRSSKSRKDDNRRRRDSSSERRPRRSVEKERNNQDRRRRESSSDRKEERSRDSHKNGKSREKSASRSPVARRRDRSSSWDSADEKATTSKSERKYDSHVPEHLRVTSKRNRDESDSESPSESASPREEKKMFGLVEMRKRTDEEKEELKKEPSKKLELVKFSTGRGSATNPKRPEPRKKLTDEEKAARLAEMQNNAKWRDEVREKNLAKGKKDDEEEKEEMDQSGYAPSFIRSQMRDACDDMTVEKRLQSTKGGIQRSHGYMDRNFAKK